MDYIGTQSAVPLRAPQTPRCFRIVVLDEQAVRIHAALPERVFLQIQKSRNHIRIIRAKQIHFRLQSVNQRDTAQFALPRRINGIVGVQPRGLFYDTAGRGNFQK